MSNSTLSVSEFINRINIGLRKAKVKIIGEISKVDIGPKGHVYFNLRDEKEQSMISCAIWKSRYDFFGIELKEGLKIIVSGAPEIYKVTGRLSFIATSIEFAGEGMLKKEYERLKEKLDKKGFFDPERKRKIPDYIQKIGVITSLKGAVIADFSNNLGKYGFKVKMIDCRVEGQEAVSDILSAIKLFKKEDIEVLVIMRGGGSLESLAPMMPFNNEAIINEVVSFKVPVISAIGHHKDIPLLSMVSDLAVSTPTASAIEIRKSWDNLFYFLEKEEKSIFYNYQNILNNKEELIRDISDKIKNYKEIIFKKHQEIENSFKNCLLIFKNKISIIFSEIENKRENLSYFFRQEIKEKKEYLKNLENFVFLNNPERQLNLGYSITRKNGKIIKSMEEIKKNDIIETKIKNGEIISEVKNIKIK